MPDRQIRPGVVRLFRLAFTSRSRVEHEIDDEIRFHIEERERQLIERGMPPLEARAEALRRFGDLHHAKVHLQRSATRHHRWDVNRQRLADVVQDVRFAFRSLRRAPGFLAVAVLCLALGIGGNVAIFSVIDAVLLKPLPYHNPEALVRVWPNAGVPPGVFEIVARESKSYASIGGVEAGQRVSLTGGADPTRIIRARATDGFFNVLGEQPMLGRTFRPGENQREAPQVAVLSHAFWMNHFGGDSAVVGRTVMIDGLPHEVVGVMAPRFAYPSSEVQVWTPAKFVAGTSSYWWTTYLQIVARLDARATHATAKAEAAVVFDGARKAFPMRMPDDWGTNIDVTPLHESMTGASKPMMLLMLGAVSLVLLIACVNVASLNLGRASVRAREMAVRTALGAGRSRLVRLLLVESLVVSIIGAAVGLLLAFVALQGLVSLLPSNTPRIGEIGIDARLLMFTLVVTLASALVFGLTPALRITRRSLMPALRSDDRTGMSQGSVRTGFALATVQVALAVTLVSGAGLLIKSCWQMRQADLGFATDGRYTAEIPIPSFANDTASRTPQFFQQLLSEVRAMPGVTSATLSSSLPFGDGAQWAAMEVEAHPTPAGGAPPSPHVVAVADDFFRTMRMSLRAGRGITADDRAHTEFVAVIDEAAAQKLWPNSDPIGHRIRYVWNQQWFTVVGVVASVRRDSMSSGGEPSLYISMQQNYPRPMRLIVETNTGTRDAERIIRSAVARVDANVPIANVQPIDDLVVGSASKPRFAALLLAVFAAVALLLGAVGIYGVLSASVARRTREIGVRIALGATASQVLRMILGQSLAIAATGVVIGTIGMVLVVRAIGAMLYGVTPTDVVVLTAVVFVLATVTMIASAIPARRAARVDPLVAMRSE